MSFREQSAWAMGLILTVAGLLYFGKVFAASQALGATAPPIIAFVVIYVVLVVIASIIVMSPLAAFQAEAANAPADERERIILNQARNWAGYVLAFGVATGLFHFWVQRDGNMLFHIAYASLMASQISEYAFQIFLYRRGHA